MSCSPRAIPLLMVVAALAHACDAREVFETRIGFDNNGPMCGATVDGVTRPMDTLIVRIDEALSPNCGQCSDGDCPHVATKCRCGPPLEVSIGGLGEMAAGLRFPDLDPERSYCLSAAAIEVGHETTRVADCPCAEAWLAPGPFPNWGRACGGARGSIGGDLLKISVNCRDNGRDIDISGCLGDP